MAPLTATEIATRLAAALVAGALVGLERERKHRPAGFRTMILISLGSCGFVVAGLAALSSFPDSGQAEVSRILQGLMSGVGFLGAGAVIQNKKAVRGLTTAAAVWVTAALGAMCGIGQFITAGMLAAFTLFTLLVLERFEERYFPEPDFDSNDQRDAHSELKGEIARQSAERKSPPNT
ncbi:MAG: MgtC/SapB family protein [Leptolyngbya sp. PLA1]|nr:MgtC/SapB family protein [Leptolyngbya sp. PLA1]